MPSEIAKGRLYLLGAAVLWSISGLVIKLLAPTVPYGPIAFYRSLFAGLVLAPLLRRPAIEFHPLLLLLAPVFGATVYTFVASTATTTAANATILQFTAPAHIFVMSVLILGERVDRHNLIALGLGSAGVAVIFFGNPAGDTRGIVLALASGLCYAVVTVCMRALRRLRPVWLTILCNLGGALVILPLAWHGLAVGWVELLVLVAFGGVQIAIPYILFARGLQRVGAQEAGLIGLLEPTLNPIWVALAGIEVPSAATLLGGACILFGLVYRYGWVRNGNGGKRNETADERG